VLYHAIARWLFDEYLPKTLEAFPEHPLWGGPLLIDFLIRRRPSQVGGDGLTSVLPLLWPLLPRLTALEVKSPSRNVRFGNVQKLLVQCAALASQEGRALTSPLDVAMALIVPSFGDALRDELSMLGWACTPVAPGHYRADSQPYPLFIVAVDEVVQAGAGGLLSALGPRTMLSDEAAAWLVEHQGRFSEGTDMAQLPGSTELLEAALARLPPGLRLKGLPPEERLKGLPPEERLKGLPPEERLKGLPPEEQVLALSDELLRRLPEQFISTLSASVRAEVHRRLAHDDAEGAAE
jgi:hypothetical protein